MEIDAIYRVKGQCLFKAGGGESFMLWWIVLACYFSEVTLLNTEINISVLQWDQGKITT